MKNILKFFFLFAYSVTIFFFSGWHLIPFALINIIAMCITKITPQAALRYCISMLPFIAFACAFNLVLGYINDAVDLAIRLILIVTITQCYKKSSTASALARAIEVLFAPLRVFKIDSRDVGLVVCISLAFLPVLRRDFSAIRLALRAKGMRLGARTFKYILKPFFVGILQRTSEISRALRVKGCE